MTPPPTKAFGLPPEINWGVALGTLHLEGHRVSFGSEHAGMSFPEPADLKFDRPISVFDAIDQANRAKSSAKYAVNPLADPM